MELYIGGYAQGKLDYVRNKYKEREWRILDGQNAGIDIMAEMETAVDKKGSESILFYHFHLWVKKLLAEGKNPEQLTEIFLEKYPGCVILADEVGNGIVPMEAQEREYRERLGRILISLAAKAERVERVICGMGQRLK